MDMTYETIQKSTESYLKAVSKLAEISPHLQRYGSGYTYFMGETFSAWNFPNPSFANGLNIRVSGLFDFGRPKVIEKSFRIYRNSFFVIQLYRTEPFEIFIRGAQHLDENGEIIQEARLRPDRHFAKLNWSEKGWGLNNWTEQIKSIEAFSESCQKELRIKIKEGLDSASKEVTDWKAALNKLTQID